MFWCGRCGRWVEWKRRRQDQLTNGKIKQICIFILEEDFWTFSQGRANRKANSVYFTLWTSHYGKAAVGFWVECRSKPHRTSNQMPLATLPHAVMLHAKCYMWSNLSKNIRFSTRSQKFRSCLRETRYRLNVILFQWAWTVPCIHQSIILKALHVNLDHGIICNALEHKLDLAHFICERVN